MREPLFLLRKDFIMHTITAISTALAPGGIGIIRISGDSAISVADSIFKSFDGTKLADLNGYCAKFGRIFYNRSVVDRVIALVFRAPHSYTGENVVEISCHGGVYIVQKILDIVLKNGAVLAQPGEFTKRAFLNGKMDLSEAESVMNLISAQGEKAEKIAVSGMEGKINKKIIQIKTSLVDIMAGLSAWSDFPDEDIPQVDRNLLKTKLDAILADLISLNSTFFATRALINGLKIAVTGCPNVGKSSLLNLLMGYQRAIVSDIAGTTRDVVEGTTMIGDIPVTLFDTAGIRDTVDIVEKLGVQRAKECLADADIIFVLFDSSRTLCENDREVISLIDLSKSIAVLNKSDLQLSLDLDEINKYFSRYVRISAKNSAGIDELKNLVYDFVGMDKLGGSEVFISGQRQFDIINRTISILKEAQCALDNGMTLDAITVLIQNSLDVLAQLTGENATDEVINAVFSKFCLGK